MRRRLIALLVLATAATAPTALAQSPAQRASAEGAFIAALSLLADGRAEPAVVKLEALLEDRPDDAAVLDALAEAYAALDRPDEALYHAELAAAATDRPEPRLRLARLQAERGDLDAAAASFEAATVTLTADAEPLIDLAETYARLGRGADERRTLNRLLAYGETAAARLRLAMLAEADGDAAAAARHLDVVVTMRPGDPALWRRLADARRAAGDADGAEAARARADLLDPATTLSPAPAASDDDLSADDVLAELNAALNRADSDPAAISEATALADRLLDLAPTRGDALAAAGEAAALAGNDRVAADRLVAAVEADVRQLGAWQLGLVVLARSGDARAGDHADEATLLFGSVPGIVAAAALAYASAGRADDARRAATSALERLADGDPLRDQIAPLAQ